MKHPHPVTDECFCTDCDKKWADDAINSIMLSLLPFILIAVCAVGIIFKMV